MGLRPAKCYKGTDKPAYTRTAVKVHRRNYIGATPGLKIRQFNMGNPTKEFTHIIDLVSMESAQVRDNALESTRIIVNRYLTKKLGKDGFFMRIRVYPYQILRENKQAQGAGADRVTKGMAHPFGKPIGRAARVRKGQKIMSLLVDENAVDIAKTAMERARSRMPCKVKVLVHTDVKSIGTRPKTIEEVVEEKAEEKEEAKETAEKGEGKEEAKPEKGKTEEKKEAKGKK